MRNLRELDKYRVEMTEDMLRAMNCVADYDRARNGVFVIPAKQYLFDVNAADLHVIAASGGGWDHVSVSIATRCPTWAEMEVIARMFFKADEVAMQLHLPAGDHINCHPFCLHWWRPLGKLKTIPLPPKVFV